MSSLNRNIIRFIQLFVFFVTLSVSWAGGNDRLNHLLDVDRLEAYLTKLSEVVKGRGNAAVAKVLLDVTPEEIDRMKLDPKKLADPSQFDDLALQVTRLKAPGIAVTKDDVTWSYNFFKRKLGEVYRVQNPKIEFTEVKTESDATSRAKRQKAKRFPEVDPTIESEHITGLDAEAYVSDRTTRGVFWEASESGRKIEYHVGTRRSFLENMAVRNVKVLGEVKAYARNYNPIFLVQEPGNTDFHYAIAEISGADRLEHLATQTSIIRWRNPSGERAPLPPVEVYGNPLANRAVEEAKLQAAMETLPHADKVVIGQKGAFERTFKVMEKRRAIEDFAKKNPGLIEPLLNDKEKKFFTKASAETSETFLATSMKNSSDWEKLYEKLDQTLTGPKMASLSGSTVFTVDRGSYEFSDFILKDKSGKSLRWRIFSNSWGDEILPIANALKNTNHTDIAYIGTAGGMPNSGLKVGDVVVPAQAVDENGIAHRLYAGSNPSSMKAGLTVAHVATPFEETTPWIKGTKTTAHLVEVETSYLGKVFDGPKDKVKVYLMISDILGSETETLAHPSSSARKKGLIDILNTVMTDGGVAGTGVGGDAITYTQQEKWVNELLPNRDEISKFQIVQKAEALGITKREDFEKLVKEEKPFTSVKADDMLIRSNRKLKRIMSLAEDAGLLPKVSLTKEFLDGSWNPSNPIDIHLQVHNAEEFQQVEEFVKVVKKEDPRLEKLLNIKISTGPPPQNFVRAPLSVTELPETYRSTALRFGGLASTENRSGAIKFIRIHDQPNQNLANGTINYFAPDEETENLLKKMNNVESAEDVLRKKILELNQVALSSHAGGYEIRYNVVDKIPGGGKAQILPTLGDGKIYVDLKITPEGLKNPAVLMEEFTHLNQITGSSVGKGIGNFTTYVNVYQWAETVGNAKSGSVQAQEKLARMELEAANSVEKSITYYRDTMHFFENTKPEVIDDYIKKRTEHAKLLYKDMDKAAKADLKVRQAAWLKQKVAFDGLEKQSLKLNDLVAKGDRKAVRKLISDYLPWPLMEPSEKRAWNQWLDAMENPDPKRTKLVFRGLADDLIMKTPKGEPFFMSTVMTHNQGSYTRRLRSLSTLRDKFGTHSIRDAVSPYNLKPESPTTLATIMYNHSIEPRGSPFLSVSDYGVASGFGGKRIGAFSIDERRLFQNAFVKNSFYGEREALIPLIVFPDEVTVYHDFELDPAVGDSKDAFLAEVQKKIGRPLTPEELAHMGESESYLSDAYSKAKDLVLKEQAPENPANCIVPALKAMYPL